MNIGEMHIEIRQGINQIAAHRVRKLQDEELDSLINKITGRYVRSLIKPRADGSGGFEVDQINLDSIRALIVPNLSLPVYKGNSSYYCIMPWDYEYLLGDWSYVVDLSGNPMPATQQVLLNLNYIRQSMSVKPEPPYYNTMDITIGEDTVSIPTDLNFGNTYSGLITKKDISSLRPWIQSKHGWYWEYFGNDYYPGCYLSPSDSTEESTMTIDGSDELIGATRVYPLQQHTGSGKKSVNRLTASNNIPNMISTAYYKPSVKSPISELAGRQLNIYSDNSFTIVSTGISYIRKCVPVSLSLGCNSELPESVHSNICDLVIEYLLSTFTTPNVQYKQQDIQSRVIL
jgi:hypothetical protein